MVVCGARGCGKTSVLEKLIYGNNGPFSSTIEDVYVVNIETDRGSKEKIRFYDTAVLGQVGTTLATAPVDLAMVEVLCLALGMAVSPVQCREEVENVDTEPY